MDMVMTLMVEDVGCRVHGAPCRACAPLTPDEEAALAALVAGGLIRAPQQSGVGLSTAGR